MNTTAMEQMAKYYWGMWGASRGVVGTTSLRSTWPPAPAAHGGGEPSWEEQAFARDAAGHIGGCVWPPRSYTCSFCRREFRSAQALGGHMNVHRRDRARLRQCASPDHDAVQDTQQQQPQLQADSPASLYRAVLQPSPKSTGDRPPNYKHQVMISSSTSPSYISTIIKESKNKIFISMPTATVREAADSDDEEEETMEEGRKRRRVDQPSAVVLPFFVRPSASCEREGLRGVDRDAKVPEVITSPSSSPLLLVGRQEVDLELRLGSSPKVA